MEGTLMVHMECPPLPYYLLAGKAVYQPGEHHPNRARLGMFDWIYVVQGELAIGEEERTWLLQPGQTLLLSPIAYHYAAGACMQKTVFYWLHYKAGGRWEEHTESLSESASLGIEAGTDHHGRSRSYDLRIPKLGEFPDEARAQACWERLVAFRAGSGSEVFWQEQQLFLELIRMQEETLERRMTPSARQLAQRTEQYLRQYYTIQIDNERLAAELHFHPNYIVRCMKMAFGCTPLEYLHLYRVEQAKQLLLKTDWSIERISGEVGFRLVPYFSACFKKRVGVSPLGYRKRYLG